MEGYLLSIEGISGTGKTFYREQLEKNIKCNDDVVFVKEIFNEVQEGLSKKIFEALYHTEDRFFNMGVPLTETMLLLSRSMYKYESTIRPALEKGKIIIEDRSIDTIALYQAILIAQKNGGNPIEIAERIYSFAGSFRKLPQKTFLLCGNPDLAIRRAEERDGIPYKPEEIKLLKAVDKFYTIYADLHPERFIKLDIAKEDSNHILREMKNFIEEKSWRKGAIKMNTLLWALNSTCNFHCKYCYLDFPEDSNPVNNKNLSINGNINDEHIYKFIEKIREYNIKRIFIAGAEPLSNPEKTFDIIKKLKKNDIQVVLCTNGYLVEKYCQDIIDSRVDALSISLDSHKKEYNDKYRQYPANDGFERVINGIKMLKQFSKIKIGIYTVLTELNFIDLEKIYEFVSDLKVDYYIFQPIFLNSNSNLYEELSLKKNNIKKLKETIQRLYNNKRETKLPNEEYIKVMIKSIENSNQCIHNCFAGDRLFFVTPDGSIHACPSSKMIPKESVNIKITDSDLNTIFIDKKIRIKECNNFSEDCVNMWQLMAFDEILRKRSAI